MAAVFINLPLGRKSRKSPNVSFQVNCRTGKIESSRVLNLRQYINLYNEIAQQASMMTQSMDASAAKTSNLTASVIFAEYVSIIILKCELFTHVGSCF